MMKKYLIVSVVCLLVAPVSVQARPERNKKVTLDEAIENVDVNLVKKLLKRKGIAEEARKKLLLETAEDVVEECEERVSLLKSGWDCARFTWWSTCTSVGALASAFGIGIALTPKGNNENNEKYLQTKKLASAGAVIGTVLTLPCVYFLTRAWKCPAALSRVENARTIENLIKNAPLSTEDTV